MSDSKSFVWLPEHDEILEQIASTDEVKTEWPKLREIIKHKLNKNIALYLSQSNDAVPTLVMLSPPRQLPSGGLKLPPFPSRPRDINNEVPKTILTQAEADNMREEIFGQLDELEGAPFTIQRLCELSLHPRKQYKFLGKYLRAVERTTLVTSAWDAFPSSSKSSGKPSNISVVLGPLPSTSAPATPMFSPIPFLHEDARRSQSRSPPPSPLTLPAAGPGNIASIMPPIGSANHDQKALGLVDELDDPSPGHLSDHPQPLSATTSLAPTPVTKQLSLEERFVKSSGESSETATVPSQPQTTTGGTEEMVVDDPEKENRAG
ncbi:PPP4R2-domain-containing protein [Irpex rosettiformis]|uniref:PPP4R2-domain-containing protein n=1 Tax=Irpex rosettiformis TaxID=378272 RepID=A0ACB8UHN9_9APHY|nr:PPP4R2-domain-containing protein [Irpex rosettiformis]